MFQLHRDFIWGCGWEGISLSLVIIYGVIEPIKISNFYTKYKIQWLLLEMIQNRSLAGCNYSELLCS